MNHPDKPQQARGLCRNCYRSWWEEHAKKPRGTRQRVRPQASCHPDRPHFAKGQCKKCWSKHYHRYGRGRDTRLARQAGVPLGSYDEYVRLQDGQCAICGTTRKQLVADHNHQTGAFRALLCTNCNSLLGHARENRHVLLRAIAYLDHFGGAECLTLLA